MVVVAVVVKSQVRISTIRKRERVPHHFNFEFFGQFILQHVFDDDLLQLISHRPRIYSAPLTADNSATLNTASMLAEKAR